MDSEKEPCAFHAKQKRFDPFCRNCQPLTADQLLIKELRARIKELEEKQE